MPKTIEEHLDTHPELKAQLLTVLKLAESDIERRIGISTPFFKICRK